MKYLNAKKKESRKVKYISLYGCKSVEQLEDNFAWLFADNAREEVAKKFKIFDKKKNITEIIYVTTIKLANLAIRKLSPFESMYKINSNWLNLSNYIFIIDDLERCTCSINEVFGFLNQLIEHEHIKVIFVANDKEIVGEKNTDNIELQYLLSTKKEINWSTQSDSLNNKSIPIAELERRRRILFPPKCANLSYLGLREKLIGRIFHYQPDIIYLIKEILNTSNLNELYCNIIIDNIEKYQSIMMKYSHNNFRTFQFYISRIQHIQSQLKIIHNYLEFQNRMLNIVFEKLFLYTVQFKCAVKYTDCQVDFEFKSLRIYIEGGELEEFMFLNELEQLYKYCKINISDKDPFILLRSQYHLHTQKWVEEKLDLLNRNIRKNYYDISLYPKIIKIILDLVNNGFSVEISNNIRNSMFYCIEKNSISELIDTDLWYIDDLKIKKLLLNFIDELNYRIITLSNYNNKAKILMQNDDWSDLLFYYFKEKENKDIGYSILDSIKAEEWARLLKKSTSKALY